MQGACIPVSIPGIHLSATQMQSRIFTTEADGQGFLTQGYGSATHRCHGTSANRPSTKGYTQESRRLRPSVPQSALSGLARGWGSGPCGRVAGLGCATPGVVSCDSKTVSPALSAGKSSCGQNRVRWSDARPVAPPTPGRNPMVASPPSASHPSSGLSSLSHRRRVDHP